MRPDADVDHLLATLAGLPTAAPTLDELGEASGLRGDRLDEALERADLAGLVEAWPDSPEGLAIMLSPLGADRLGLRLEEVGEVGRFRFRWRSAAEVAARDYSEDRSRMIPASVVAPEMSPSEFFDAIADPKALQPVEMASRAELMERSLPPTAEDLAEAHPAQYVIRPTILLGLRPTWNGPLLPDGPCPGCGGLPLGLYEVCLMCLRVGCQHLLPPVTAKHIRALRDPLDVLAGGQGKSRSRGKAPGVPKVKPRTARAKGGRPEGEEGQGGCVMACGRRPTSPLPIKSPGPPGT